MRKFALLLAVSSLLAVIAACGGSSSNSKTATPGTPAGASGLKSPAASKSATVAATDPAAQEETAFAKSMLLTAADFPAGYIETPAAANEPENPLNKACGQASEKGKTGKAASSDFSAAADAPSISEEVIVFGKESDASAGLDAIPALIDCAVKAINDGKLNNGGVEFSNTASKKISIDAPGDKSYAFEVTAAGKVTGRGGGDLSVVFSLVFGRKGRVGYQITVSGTAALGAAELSGYAQKAAAKIKQQP